MTQIIIDIDKKITRHGGESCISKSWEVPLVGRVVISETTIGLYEAIDDPHGIVNFKKINKSNNIYLDFVHAAFQELLKEKNNDKN